MCIRMEYYYRVMNDLYVRQYGSEYIVFPIGPAIALYKNMIRLNEVGAALWEIMMENRSFSEIVSMLLEEYDVEQEDAQQAVSDFLLMLERENLLIKEKIDGQ